MPTPPLEGLRAAVWALMGAALGTGVLVYLLMELRFRAQVRRQARRLILANRLPASLDPKTFADLWAGSGARDRAILEEILLDVAASGLPRGRGEAVDAVAQVRESLMGCGIYERWLKELVSAGMNRRVRAALNLGLVADARGVESLAKAAKDAPPRLASAIVVSLGQLRHPLGLAGLVHIAQKARQSVPEVTLAAAMAACAAGNPLGLAGLLKDTRARTRTVAAWAISEIADPPILPNLLEASKDAEAEVRAKVARALGRIPGRESFEALSRLASDRVWFVRVRALDALGGQGERGAEEVVRRSLDESVREARYRAANALRRLRGMESQTVVSALAGSSRRAINTLISEWERAGFLWQVVRNLRTGDWAAYRASVDVVRSLAATGITRALMSFTRTYPDLKVRIRLVRILAERGGKQARAELAAVAAEPGRDARFVAAIRRAIDGAPRKQAAVPSGDAP